MVKLVDSVDLYSCTVYWFPDESGAVFGVIHQEFGIDLYYLDVSTTKAIPYPPTLINRGLSEWSLSPDGKSIAVVTNSLQIYSLDGQVQIELPGNHRNVRWSRDSQALYYIQGEDWYDSESESIYRYRIDTGITTKIISWAELGEKGIIGYDFEISPYPNQILYWSPRNI